MPINIVLVGLWASSYTPRFWRWLYYFWLTMREFGYFPLTDLTISHEKDYLDPYQLTPRYKPPAAFLYEHPAPILWSKTPPTTEGFTYINEQWSFALWRWPEPFSVAHELRNLAAVINGCKNLIAIDLDDAPCAK